MWWKGFLCAVLLSAATPCAARSSQPTAAELTQIRAIVRTVLVDGGPCMQYAHNFWNMAQGINVGNFDETLYTYMAPVIDHLCWQVHEDIHYHIFGHPLPTPGVWPGNLARFGSLVDFEQQAEDATHTFDAVAQDYWRGYAEYALYATWKLAIQYIGVVRADEVRMEQGWHIQFAQHIR